MSSRSISILGESSPSSRKQHRPATGPSQCKHELAFDRHRNEWFTFVGLRGLGQRPDFYIVPRNLVVSLIFVSHRKWLNDPPSRPGGSRNDTTNRWVAPKDVGRYLEAWELLEEATDEVEIVAPDWYRQAVPGFPLMDEHPERARFSFAA